MLTTTHFYPPQSLEITGLVSGTSRIAGVDVAVGDAAGAGHALRAGGGLAVHPHLELHVASCPSGALPDGELNVAAATATDGASTGSGPRWSRL